MIEDATTYLNIWAKADAWCQTLIKGNSAWKGHKKLVTMPKSTTAMNKVTTSGGYNEMRDYNSNMHGFYANKKEFTKNSLRKCVYSYLATGVHFQRC